jgi:hypothetical protein
MHHSQLLQHMHHGQLPLHSQPLSPEPKLVYHHPIPPQQKVHIGGYSVVLYYSYEILYTAHTHPSPPKQELKTYVRIAAVTILMMMIIITSICFQLAKQNKNTFWSLRKM